MRTKVIGLLIGALLLLGMSVTTGRCQDTGARDTVAIEYVSTGIQPNTQLVVEVTMFNDGDDSVSAVVLPLTFYDAENPDIRCDSASFAGGIADYFELFKVISINNNDDPEFPSFPPNFVGIVAIPCLEDSLDPESVVPYFGPRDKRELLAKIYFTTGPNWRADREAVLDTIFWPPSSNLVLCDAYGRTYVPVFVNHREGLVAKPLGVSEVPGVAVPKEFSLSQNYPNPFNPETSIKFSLDKPSDVNVAVYNILGQKIRTLVSEKGMRTGVYETKWNGKDESGKSVASGMYLYRVVAGDKSETRKMMLLK